MSMTRYAVGVDYGTNSVRVLIVDLEDGREVATSVVGYPTGDMGIILDPKRPTLARQSPRDYVDCFMLAVRNAVDAARKSDPLFSPNYIVGLGVDSTGSTPIPVDAEGIPLAFQEKFANIPAANAWLWKDHTAIEEAEAITRRVYETGANYLEKSGGTYNSEWYWAKVWRCLRESPEVFDAAYSWVELADFIPAYVTGNTKPETLARCVCAAGHKGMWSATNGGFPSSEFFASLEPRLVPIREHFAKETKTAAQVVGYLTSEIAEKTWLKTGTPVAVGAFDAYLGAVGSGVKPGTLVTTVGTSAGYITVTPLDVNLQSIPGVCVVAPGSVIPDAFGIVAGQSAVGDIFRWFERTLSPSSSGETGATLFALEKDVAKLAPGESGLVALDWNNGNRCVLADQALTGMIVGTTLGTTAAEIYRALIEATAFGGRAIIERMEEYGVAIDEIVVCGGIAEKSPTIMQIYADVWNKPLKIARSSQTCALGSALMGAVAGGAFANVAEAQRATVGYKDASYLPRSSAVDIYDRLYPIYKKLHDAFGVKGADGELYSVMKNLIAIRDSVR